MAEENRTLSWHARPHKHVERSVDWFWALGIAAVSGAALAILFGNLLLAVIIVIGAFSIGTVASREPREHHIRITNQGIAIDKTLYPYRSLNSFWIDDETYDDPHLILSLGSIVTPQLIIPIAETVELDELHETLLNFIDEEEQYESAATRVAEFFGF